MISRAHLLEGSSSLSSIDSDDKEEIKMIFQSLKVERFHQDD